MKVNFLKRVLWWVLAATAVLNAGAALAFCDEHPDLPTELKKSDSVVTAVVESERNVSSPEDPQGVEEIVTWVRVSRQPACTPLPTPFVTAEASRDRLRSSAVTDAPTA